jgi:hypothetical protein
MWTAAEACNILKEIGTAAAVQPIQDVLKGKPHFLVEQAGTAALKAIQDRQKGKTK